MHHVDHGAALESDALRREGAPGRRAREGPGVGGGRARPSAHRVPVLREPQLRLVEPASLADVVQPLLHVRDLQSDIASSGLPKVSQSPAKKGSLGSVDFPRISARAIHHLVAPAHYGLLMGRPKIYEEPRVATAIRLPTSLREELQAAAVEREVSVNFLVTRAVSDYLGQLPSVSDDQSRPRRRRRRTTVKASS